MLTYQFFLTGSGSLCSKLGEGEAYDIFVVQLSTSLYTYRITSLGWCSLFSHHPPPH